MRKPGRDGRHFSSSLTSLEFTIQGFTFWSLGWGGLGSWQKGYADVFKQQHRKGVGEELFLLIKGETKQNEGSPRKIQRYCFGGIRGWLRGFIE